MASNPDLSGWYILSPQWSDRYIRLAILTEEETRITSLNWVLSGEYHPSPPIRLKVSRGSLKPDLMAANPITIICLSHRFADILREREITGWSTYDVSIVDRRGMPLEGYFGLSVAGRVGPFKTQPYRVKEYPATMAGAKPFRVGIGRVVNLAGWDGSDICLSPDTYFIFVSPRAAEAILASGMAGLELEPIEAFEVWISPSESYPS